MARPSWQARLLNTLLRSTVKDRMFPASQDPAVLRRAKRRIQRLERLLPAANASVTPERLPHCQAEWVDASGGGDRVILYFHGGAYATCSPRTHRDLTAALSRQCRARVLVPDYRQGPEHVFPAWLEDAVDAYERLLSLGIPPGRIMLAGDSAGGNLVLATLLKLRDMALPLPAGGICLSPWADLACRGESYARNGKAEAMLNPDGIRLLGLRAAGGTPLDEPLLSPVHANFQGLPPLQIQVGSTEILLDDARLLRDRARSAGVTVDYVEWQEVPHVVQAFVRFIPEARDGIQRAADFAGRCLG